MDSKIKKAIAELRKITSTLYKDRDMGAIEYSELKMMEDKIEGKLLCYDEAYDLKHKRMRT